MFCSSGSIRMGWYGAQSSHRDQPGALAWSKWGQDFTPHPRAAWTQLWFQLGITRALLHISIHLIEAGPCFGLLTMPCKVCLSEGGAANFGPDPEQSRVLSQTLARNKRVRKTARKSRISKRGSIAGISF